MPVSPAAWSSSSRMSLGGGEGGGGGGGEVVLAVDGGEVVLAVDGGGEVVLAVDGGGGGGISSHTALLPLALGTFESDTYMPHGHCSHGQALPHDQTVPAFFA